MDAETEMVGTLLRAGALYNKGRDSFQLLKPIAQRLQADTLATSEDGISPSSSTLIPLFEAFKSMDDMAAEWPKKHIPEDHQDLYLSSFEKDDMWGWDEWSHGKTKKKTYNDLYIHYGV